MRRKGINSTKLEIIQVALQLFLEKGYTETSARAICKELDISLGNLTYFFPSKEHLLSLLINMLCDFQWKLMREEAEDGISNVLAICLELMTMAAAAEEDKTAKDLFISAYTSPLTLEIMRKNDAARAKMVFAEYCEGWTNEQFVEAEALVSGIEYATFMTTKTSSPLEVRIAGALDVILTIYQVPQEIKKKKIEKVLSMDYRKIGGRIFTEFKEYVEGMNENAFEEMLSF